MTDPRAMLDRYPTLRIAIVGDFCLDRYLEIDPAHEEISIETGLPVHNVMNVRAQPGGAGTVLANLAALGVGTILPVGWCGDDGEGYELRKALAATPGVSLDHFAMTPSRRTFTYCKPLIVEAGAPPRELSRLDSKNWTPTPTALTLTVIDSLKQIAEAIDAIVLLEQVSEPETGVITPAVLAEVDRIAGMKPALRMLGDSRRGLTGWPRVSLKMNAAELARMTDHSSDLTTEAIDERSVQLATQHGRDVFVTLAEQGMMAATPGGEIHRIPALPLRGPVDVVGAGDAVTANLAAALAAGAELNVALSLATVAASIVIHKLGTTGTASREEILSMMNGGM